MAAPWEPALRPLALALGLREGSSRRFDGPFCAAAFGGGERALLANFLLPFWPSALRPGAARRFRLPEARAARIGSVVSAVVSEPQRFCQNSVDTI
mmetsp:Transcript_9335/g.27957  ORF Transcript_9335/g.27957 Transcript_9335/m.27957 type:complete len:96 (+) Transcript_9335:210-497(+)